MSISIVLSYFFGLWISYSNNRSVKSTQISHQTNSKLSKLILLLAILCHVGILLYFKYTDFAINSINQITSSEIPLRKIALPLGISFYTFQILSYLIDLYFGRIKVQYNFISYAAYVSMFPQLVAGPIVRYQDIETEISSRKVSSEDISYGIRRFLLGLSKKVILADNLGKIETFYFVTSDPSILYVWLYAISFTLQIYFDFSGYSDMAIGLGRMMGFHFPENFDYPYISKSITEFWRRWHMTLGGWFRDYIYIPLGGNRCNKFRFICNIMIVWALTGLWHGAAWNFVLWGLYYGILLLIEKFLLNKYVLNKVPAFFNHIYVVIITIFGFVLFGSNSLHGTLTTIRAMFGVTSNGNLPFTSIEAIYYLRSYAVLLLLGILFATPLAGKFLKFINAKVSQTNFGKSNAYSVCKEIIISLVLLILFILCTAYIVDENFHPFLYFRF